MSLVNYLTREERADIDADARKYIGQDWGHKRRAYLYELMVRHALQERGAPMVAAALSAWGRVMKRPMVPAPGPCRNPGKVHCD